MFQPKGGGGPRKLCDPRQVVHSQLLQLPYLEGEAGPTAGALEKGDEGAAALSRLLPSSAEPAATTPRAATAMPAARRMALAGRRRRPCWTLSTGRGGG